MAKEPDATLKYSDAVAKLFHRAKWFNDGNRKMICDQIIVEHFTGNEEDVVIYERDGKRRAGRIRLLMGLSSSSPATPTSATFNEEVEEIDADDEKRLLTIYDQLCSASESFIVTFPDATAAEANRLASTFADALREIDQSVVVDRQRERPDTQDFGATLAVILGTAAVTALAKGIAAWLARNSGARIEIRRHGKVVLTATHLDSKDVPRIAQALSSDG